MSNNPASFSFPPPPPPPPIVNSGQSNGSGSNTSNNYRGRGNSHGSHRGSFTSGRGRGFGWGRGNDRYPGNRLSFQHHSTVPAQTSNHTQKRTFGAAFGQNPQSRPQAPPAVPSFSASLDYLLPTKPAPPSSMKSNAHVPKKSNILGLTPAQLEGSDSEDDGDEETRLAAAASGGDIQFEYKGHVSTLRTPAEIAAWITERRKRYPTQAKREAARKEAAERKLRFEEQKKARQESLRKVREERNDKRKAKQPRRSDAGKENTKPAEQNLPDPKEQAELRAEKLRRKLEKAKRDLAAAEAAISGKPRHGQGEDNRTAHEGNPDLDSDGSTSEPSTLYDSDATSSSGSDEDSDSAPEEISSKTQQPAIPRSPTAAPSASDKVCSFFSKSGQCKYGKRCRYAHVRAEGTARPSKPTVPGSGSARKGLWQVMVEKEQEEEQKRVLRAVIALGEAGMLEQPKA